jgi:hypothetical protein
VSAVRFFGIASLAVLWCVACGLAGIAFTSLVMRMARKDGDK